MKGTGARVPDEFCQTPAVPRGLKSILISLGALVLVVAACGGAEPGHRDATGTAAPATGPVPDTAAGETLTSFVDAAGNADGSAMWELLSRRSRNRLGPSESDFERRFVRGFQAGIGSFAGTGYTTVLSVRTPSGWGIAAIAGRRVRHGTPEFASYAAVLRLEGGTWKLELGDPVRVVSVEPRSGSRSDVRPPIVVRITAASAVQEAGLWLDGAALPARVQATDGRDIRVEGRPAEALSSGWHVVVAFGRAGDLASAGAAPIRVTGAAAPVA